jgi:hypothetical protein
MKTLDRAPGATEIMKTRDQMKPPSPKNFSTESVRHAASEKTFVRPAQIKIIKQNK